MAIPVLDESLFFLGLVLIALPAGMVPYLSVDARSPRVIKHGLGLILFASGVLGIHQRMRAEWGESFLITSIFLLLIISLVRVWWFTRDKREEA